MKIKCDLSKLQYLVLHAVFFCYFLVLDFSVSFQNKSAFLCGVMKTYRQREKQGTKVSDTNKGPDEAKIKVRVDALNQYVSSFCFEQ